MTPKKLLIADHNSKPKTKLGPPATPPNSASSSSTTTLPPDKRTRDLPNLSDCHCCGVRINYSNPKDRLQPLDSIWRIVLLCRSCSKKVQSGQTCPYCFKETENSGIIIVKCRDCNRRIHQDCVKNFGDCTPWRYLGLGLGFRVCVDCWVPDLLKNSVRINRRSDNKDVVKCCATEGDKSCPKKGKKVDCEVEKMKIVTAGKEEALRKSVVQKNAVELSKNGLDMADKNGISSDSTNCDGVEVVDDVELAIQLHRAMNSSPRILRNRFTGESSCSENLKSRESDSLPSRRSDSESNGGEGLNPITSINVMEDEMLMRTNEDDSCLHACKSNQGVFTYKRDRERKIWKVDDSDVLVSESKCSEQDDLANKLHMDDSKSRCQLRFNGDVYKRDKKRKIWHLQSDDATVSESKFNQEDDFKDNLHLNGAKSSCPLKSNGDIYRRDKRRKIWQVYDDSVMVSEPGFNQQDLLWPPSDAIERFRQEAITYKRTRIKSKTCLENGKEPVFGDCNSGFCERLAVEPQCRQHDDLNHELPLRGGSKDSCSVQCDDEVTLEIGSCKEEPDRYFFKYGLRQKGAKSGSIGKTKLHSQSSQNENQAPVVALVNRDTSLLVEFDDKLTSSDGILHKEDRYFFKYGKRTADLESGSNCETNVLSDNLHKEHRSSAPGLTLNVSSKSRMLSNVSFGFCPVSLQAQTSVGCLSDNEPDCYFFKYSQRVTGSKSGSNFEANVHCDDMQKEPRPLLLD